MSERASELVAEDLLGRHVRGRPDARAGHGQVVVVVLVARDAEIHQLHAALARDHDVRGLDVAVDDAAVVHVIEGARDLHRDDRGDVVGQAAAALEQVIQVDAADVLHHDEERAPLAMEVVDMDDVFVLEAGQGAGLALEAGGQLLVRADRGLERLDGHHPVELLLDGAVDDGHSAGRHLLHNPAISDSFEHLGCLRTLSRNAATRVARGRAAENAYTGLTRRSGPVKYLPLPRTKWPGL